MSNIVWPRICTISIAFTIGVLPSLAAQTYQVRGLLLKVDPQEQTIVVSQDKIPGYMDAMVMPYRVSKPGDLEHLQPGAKVQFTLTVDREQSFISSIQILSYDSADREPLQAKSLAFLDRTVDSSRTRPLSVGQQVADFKLVDQTGRHVALSDFAGKVVAITFVYTRCPLPDYCLRLSNNFGRLQKRFPDRMGSDLVLLSVTFDPVHDTPDVLAKYGEIWGAQVRGWHLLTGPVDEVKTVCNLFGSNFWQEEGTLTHSLHTVVIDRKGKLVANVEGNQFTSDQLGDLIQIYF